MKTILIHMAHNNPKRKKIEESVEESMGASGSESDFWPSFVVLTGTEENKAPGSLSPFIIQRVLKGCIGTAKKVTKLRSGDLLVEVERRAQSKQLLQLTDFYGIKIAAAPHKTLNFKKGVIRCNELKDVDASEIISELKSQGVSDAFKIVYRDNGQAKSTGTVILTFSCQRLPTDIKVGYLNVRVSPYIPNPLRCYKCQKYGHGSKGCKRAQVCSKCGSEEHEDAACDEPPSCVNCAGDHAASDKNCPVWVQEREIQKIRVEKNISFADARKLLSSTTKTSAMPTYAAATTKTPVMCSVETQTEFIEIKTPLKRLQPLKKTTQTHTTQTGEQNRITPQQKSQPTKPKVPPKQNVRLNVQSGLARPVALNQSSRLPKNKKSTHSDSEDFYKKTPPSPKTRLISGEPTSQKGFWALKNQSSRSSSSEEEMEAEDEKKKSFKDVIPEDLKKDPKT